MVFTTPFYFIYIYYLKFKLKYIDLKLKYSPNDVTLLADRDSTKRILNTDIQLELGLETIFQLAAQLTLLGLSNTETATHSDLKTMFSEIPSKSYNLHDWMKNQWISFKAQLVISNMISFFGCMNSHLKGVYACREHFSILSKFLIVALSFFGCTSRVLAIVMYFAAPLGLFNLLRHLEGETLPWNAALVANFFGPNATGMVYFGGSEPVDYDLLFRWKKNTSVQPFLYIPTFALTSEDVRKLGHAEWNPDYLISPPDYTLYTIFDLKTYFYIFLGLLVIHIIAVFVAKYKTSTYFVYRMNFVEKFIHAFENTNIPFNSQEWDDGKGDASELKMRMEANHKEMRLLICIQTFFNLLLMLPMLILGEAHKTINFVHRLWNVYYFFLQFQQ